MTKQPMTGPNRMRKWADYIEQNVRHHLLPLAVKNPDTLRELAAQWDADRAALERAANDLMLSEESFVTMRAKRDEVLSELRTTRAALERARALLAELAACGYECEAGALENNQAYRELAALLAPAPGGAA